MKQIRSLLVLATLIVVGSSTLAFAQPFVTKDLTSATCPGSGCVVLQVDGQGSYGVQIAGTFTGTLQFEQSIDGITYVSLSMVPNTLGATVTSTTAIGFWTAPIAGARWVRVRFSAYTSGTATVSNVTANARAPTNSAGSAGSFSSVFLGDGTAAAPSLAFSSQPTVGFYKYGNGTFGYSNGSIPVILFDASANVTLFSSGALQWGIGAIDLILTRDAANILAQKNGTNAQKFRLYQNTTGPIANTLDATAPTISSGFGTTPSIVAGSTAFSMRINVGTGGVATSGVIAVPTATTGWNCQVQDMTTNTATRQSASTTGTITFTAAAAWTASDILVATCIAF